MGPVHEAPFSAPGQLEFFHDLCPTCHSEPFDQGVSQPCAACLKRLCHWCEREGLALRCHECQALLCREHAVSCSYCEEPHCAAHLDRTGMCAECRSLACPNCGEMEAGRVEVDYGIEAETGYHDVFVGCDSCAPKGH